MKVCNTCQHRNMNYLKPADKNIYSLLNCNHCRGLIWNRDVNAALNIKHISETIWATGERPPVFSRPPPSTTTTTTTLAAASNAVLYD